MVGAVSGGLLAGLGLTVMLLAGARESGRPSELVLLRRASARKQGIPVPPDTQLPGAAEQAVVQGGHLLLSAAAGAAYALVVHKDARVASSGISFGLAFYAAMHWIAGPVLGIKKPEWQSGAKTITMHAINHVGFGLVTAMGSRLASSR